MRLQTRTIQRITELEQAYEKYEQFNNDERLRSLDEAHQRFLHDLATDIEEAHHKGVGEGVEKGKSEEKIEIARYRYKLYDQFPKTRRSNMRLWSLHPCYLDTKGLLAVWREGLLAKHVLEGKTKGYRNHPQLLRFKQQENPVEAISQYLSDILTESIDRGYHFDGTKIITPKKRIVIPVTIGQMEYEKRHLLTKLEIRAPERTVNGQVAEKTFHCIGCRGRRKRPPRRTIILYAAGIDPTKHVAGLKPFVVSTNAGQRGRCRTTIPACPKRTGRCAMTSRNTPEFPSIIICSIIGR